LKIFAKKISLISDLLFFFLPFIYRGTVMNDATQNATETKGEKITEKSKTISLSSSSSSSSPLMRKLLRIVKTLMNVKLT